MINQILGVIPPGLMILMAVVIFTILPFIFKYIYKIDIKSAEMRVLIFYILGVAILLLIAIIGLTVFNSDILLIFIAFPPALIFVIYSLIYILRVIRNQESSLKSRGEQLKKIIKSAEKVALNVANMAIELSSSASEVSSASEEVSMITQENSENSKNLMNSLLEIENMAAFIKNISSEMVGSTKDINNIMNILVGISEQTNLLALNASIEAGRAGDYGRGFAVVAEEVRKLAEESKNKINQSESKISTIIDKIEKTVNYIEGISESIKIASETSKINASQMVGISSSAEEQSASMEEITSTAQRLGSIAEELKKSLNLNF